MFNASKILMGRGYWRVNFKDDPENPGGGGGEGAGDPPADPKATNEGDPSDPKPASPDGEGEGEGDGAAASKGAKGGNSPSDREAALLKEVMQRKEAQNKLKGELEAIKANMANYEGIDLTEVKKLLKDREDAETAKLEAKGDYERLKAKMAEQHKQQIADKEAELEAIKAAMGQSQGVIEKLTVGHAFDASKFISDELTLTPSKARIIYGEYFDIDEGRLVAFDKPRGSKERTPLVNSMGENVPFDEALRKIVEADPDKDALIKAKMKSGAGSNTGEIPAKPAPRKLSSQEKIAAALAKQ